MTGKGAANAQSSGWSQRFAAVFVGRRPRAGGPQALSANDVVPPTGFTAALTLFTAAAMAFLAVFALALAVSAGQLADRWSDALARTATIRISAPAGQVEAQTRSALTVLETTPGIATARVLEAAEQQALLEPWLGPNLPLNDLPLPRLIEVTETTEGFSPENLRLRLAAEAPGAILDDHTRWRRPLIAVADRLRGLGVVATVLIAGAVAAMITLAANAALAANGQVIAVLRLVGARDIYIARAFMHRFTLRSFVGALVGTALGAGAILLLPAAGTAGGENSFLSGLGFSGGAWALLLLVPILAAGVAYFATRHAALRMLRKLA